MREILFKAKRKDNGEWVEGFYVCNRYSIGFAKEPAIYENHYVYTKRIDGEKWFKTIQVEVIPETLGQFTGLTDKNGKNIFEGDIVKTKFGRLCVVEWRSTQCFCGFDFTVCICNANNKTKAPSAFDLYFPENLEIIGNIHDNKELLGENK
jgi:uncharacterized phage protein (TIGR01671 family)